MITKKDPLNLTGKVAVVRAEAQESDWELLRFSPLTAQR